MDFLKQIATNPVVYITYMFLLFSNISITLREAQRGNYRVAIILTISATFMFLFGLLVFFIILSKQL